MISKNKTATVSPSFLLALQLELERHIDGINEYELMQVLKAQGGFDFLSEPALPHELFQAHFFLFHALYLLQDILSEQKSYLLDIHTLKIQLRAYQQGEQSLQLDDKLKTYYLDFSNLENTSEEDVCELLASFWNRFNRFENRDEALAQLGLQDPVDNKTIKKEYRRLIMQHHPDRGGDTQKLQILNDVVKTLLG